MLLNQTFLLRHDKAAIRLVTVYSVLNSGIINKNRNCLLFVASDVYIIVEAKVDFRNYVFCFIERTLLGSQKQNVDIIHVFGLTITFNIFN